MVERQASVRKEEEKKKNQAAEKEAGRFGERYGVGVASGFPGGGRVVPRMGTGTVATAVNGEIDVDLGSSVAFDDATPAVSHEPTSGVAVAPEVVYPNQAALNAVVTAQKPFPNGMDE
jgi:hypothetical protein